MVGGNLGPNGPGGTTNILISIPYKQNNTMYQKHQNQWVLASLNSKQKNSKELKIFLIQFYASLEDQIKLPGDKGQTTKSQLYKQSVLNLIEESKSKFPLSEIELRQLQLQIEDYSMKFDESTQLEGRMVG